MPKASPSWRKIEAALIELLREEGLEIEDVKGNKFLNLYNEGHEEDDEPITVCIGDFAKELEQRL